MEDAEPETRELFSPHLEPARPAHAQPGDVRRTFICMGCGIRHTTPVNSPPPPTTRCGPCQLRSPFLNLPAELHLEIAQYLDCAALLALKICNQMLYGRISLPISCGDGELLLLLQKIPLTQLQCWQCAKDHSADPLLLYTWKMTGDSGSEKFCVCRYKSTYAAELVYDAEYSVRNYHGWSGSSFSYHRRPCDVCKSEDLCLCHFKKTSMMGLGIAGKRYVCRSRRKVSLDYHCPTCHVCRSEEFCLCHYERTSTPGLGGKRYVCRDCRKACLKGPRESCNACGSEEFSLPRETAMYATELESDECSSSECQLAILCEKCVTASVIREREMRVISTQNNCPKARCGFCHVLPCPCQRCLICDTCGAPTIFEPPTLQSSLHAARKVMGEEDLGYTVYYNIRAESSRTFPSTMIHISGPC